MSSHQRAAGTAKCASPSASTSFTALDPEPHRLPVLDEALVERQADAVVDVQRIREPEAQARRL